MEDIENDERYSDWEENDDEDCFIIDLFSTQTFTSVDEFLRFNESNGFDLLELIRETGSDEIGIIMLINFIRSEVKAAADITLSFKNSVRVKALAGEYLSGDVYMKPVLNDDNLLFLLGEYLINHGVLSESKHNDHEWEADPSVAALFEKVTAADNLSVSEISRLRAEMGDIEDVDDSNVPTGDYYFDGYSHIGIHETMLRDAVRTKAYGEALLQNSTFLRGKVVLDIGCGTGILCLFAARAGARKVVGVDCSSMALKAREIVMRNGYQDVVTIVRGQLEDVDLPLEPGEVDVIVSEWMGYGLYYENMLPAVLEARDRYLKGVAGVLSAPSPPAPAVGSMLPSHAFLFLEAGSEATDATPDSYDGDRVGWWSDVYGFDMSDMVDLFTTEAQVDLCSPACIVSDRARVHSLEILQARDADLDFDVPFELVRNCVCATHGSYGYL